MIYGDQAATSYPKPKCVQEAVIEAMNIAGNPGRSNDLSASRLIFKTRKVLKDYFHAPKKSCVIFNSGNTESLNTAIKGLCKNGDHVITTYAEHNSVLRPLYELEDANVIELSITSPNLQSMKQAIKENTRFIIMSHCSNVTGELFDVQSIGIWAKQHGIVLIVDCAQSAGHVMIDMEAWQIDVLCFSGHKGLLGLAGVGGMIIKEELDMKPLKTGGTGIHSFDRRQSLAYPERLEAGTINLCGIASLLAGIQYINQKPDMHKTWIKELHDLSKELETFEVYSNVDSIGIFAFNIKGVDASKVSDILYHKYNIITRCGAHCAPLMMKHLNQDSLVRISLNHLNSEDDLKQIKFALMELNQENL